MKSWMILLVGALLAVSGAGCGGSDAEGEVEAALRTVTLSHDPETCTELVTQNQLEQSSGESGEDALRDCEADTTDTKGDYTDVKVSEVQVDGEEATARAEFVGGGFDGQTLSVAFVEEDGRWKVDELRRFVDFDRPALVAALAKVGTEKEEAPVAQLSCIVHSVSQMSQRRIEAVTLRNAESAPIALLRECPERVFTGDDTLQIARVLTAYFRGTEPSKCIEFVTPAFLEQASGLQGEAAALAKCVEAVEAADSRPELVIVWGVRVDRDKATAKLEATGTGLEHQVFEMAMVRRDGNWRLDQRLGLVRFDRARLVEEFLAAVAERDFDVSDAAAACVRQTILSTSRAEFEALLTEPGDERARQLGERCLGGKGLPTPS